jgi:hypothetical protein
VGNDGETLVADSSTSTGLRYTSNFAAGKNAIINGAFNVWQRGTSFTSPTSNTTYTADRWLTGYSVAPTTYSVSQQAFTAGTAPVAGYEGTYFYRGTITTAGSNTAWEHKQRIEDVRTFAGQTVTLSFWAKADSSRTGRVFFLQNFGSGGSGSVYSTAYNISLTTSWTRFTQTVSIASVSGKTIGTGSYLEATIEQPSANGSVIDIWGVQVETGSVATAFQTATGTIQGELAACCRYYWRANATGYGYFAASASRSTTQADSTVFLPVPMRVVPSLSSSAANTFMIYENAGINVGTAIGPDSATVNTGAVSLSVASGLVGRGAGNLRANNTAAYLEFSAEL